MVVNFEFLGDEPIENIITCLNFKIDKVVFLGYSNKIKQYKTMTTKYLKDYCGVKEVVFRELPQKDMNSILKIMRQEIEFEINQNNKVYFDITGGEYMILVAFGMLSKELNVPIHMYDVPTNQLIELSENEKININQGVESEKKTLTLDLLIQMNGGIINEKMQKELKGLQDTEFVKDSEGIYQIAKEHWEWWNPFSEFLRNHMVPNGELIVERNVKKVANELSKSSSMFNSVEQLNELLVQLAEIGVILDLAYENGTYHFKFKTQQVKECLWEGGSVLELHVFHQEVAKGYESRIGVHLDWDGIIHEKSEKLDVLNEVDVISLSGNVPTFISCKSGKLEGGHALFALYELDEIARKFGGKYSKKVLVTAKDIGSVYLERAKEMGIEVKCEK